MMSFTARRSQLARTNVSADVLVSQLNKQLAKTTNPKEQIEILRNEFEDNNRKTQCLLMAMKRSNGNSALIAHQSGIISARKDYSRRLRLFIEQAMRLYSYNNGYFN